MAERFLVAGLGNPGKRYEQTRHNAGFMVVDHLAARFRVGCKAGKGEYVVSEIARHEENELLLLKPMTYMNHSGMAVRHALDYFKVDLGNLLVVLDEFQLPFGKLRLRPDGSDGGHNGLASVIQHLGSQEFARLRLGVGSAFQGDPADFVLAKFSKAERAALPEVMARTADVALDFIAQGVQFSMNRHN